MTLPSNIRIFFGIDLNEATKKSIGHFIQSLKKASKTYAIRWSRPENLHITLQFLDNFKSDDLHHLLDNVKKQLKNMSIKLSFSFTTLDLYPSPYHPRVIVLDVVPQSELESLSRAIGAGITASAYKTEDRAYRAHVTLGRIKQPNDVSLQFLNKQVVPIFEEITMDEIVLFRSEPQTCGSLYTVLERLSF